MWQAQYHEPLEGVAARGVAAGRRFLSVWQAQYLEPLEGVAARGVAAGRRFCLCGRRSVRGARCGRWAPVSVCAAGAASRASKGVAARGVAAGRVSVCVAGAISRSL